MTARFLDILVESHAALPDGCSLRYKLESAPRPVRRVRYEPDDGPAGIYRVEGLQACGTRIEALAAEVEDSGAGTSVLVYGGELGLRLVPESGGPELAEPYLLVAPEEILD